MHTTAIEQNTCLAEADDAFRRDALSGLARYPRHIPPRWFYNKKGSELFERITALPEYYPTRAEREILATHMKDIVRTVGKQRVVVEYGSGSSSKTVPLLREAHASAYVPLDISGEFLREAVDDLSLRVPEVPMFAMEADFSYPITLPRIPGDHPRLGFFPGSTIGNLTEPDAVDLLRRMADTLGQGAMLLIGMDRYKDEATLVAAYDDAQGVTAQFNLNLLRRMREELGAEIDIDAFGHLARWNGAASRIEMHLQARRPTVIRLAGKAFAFAAGETIHTENSYKLTPGEARLLLRAGGWAPVAEWTDARGLFSVHALTRIADGLDY